jgi:hypothetical protein
MSESAFWEGGFGDGDDKVGSKSKRFKAKEGEKYRVSFVSWPGSPEGKPNMDASTPKFIGCKRLYMENVGYFIDKGPEFAKIAGGPGKMYVATLICVWPTDSKGNLDKGRFQNGDFEVMPWVISIDKYRNIEQNHKEFPLGMHDLTISCTDTQYQKMTLSPCRENLFRKLYEKDPTGGIAARVVEATQSALMTLPGELAHDMTIEQIRAKLSGKGGGGSAPSSGTGTAVNSKELESMLDDIL